MTELMGKQLIVMAVMFCCGMTAGLLDEVGKGLHDRLKRKKTKLMTVLAVMSRIGVFCIDGYMITAYLYYCNFGTISGSAIFAFIIGLWLWKQWICGKIKD